MPGEGASVLRGYDAAPDLLSRTIECLDCVWPSISRTIEAAGRIGLRWGEVSTPFVLMKDERVLSHVGVMRMPLVLSGRQEIAAGIHAVATRPEWRRRGAFRTLMAEALQWADTRHQTLILTTDQPWLYESFGFRTVPEHRWVGPWPPGERQSSAAATPAPPSPAPPSHDATRPHRSRVSRPTPLAGEFPGDDAGRHLDWEDSDDAGRHLDGEDHGDAGRHLDGENSDDAGRHLDGEDYGDTVRHLDWADPGDVELLHQLLETRAPVSRRLGVVHEHAAFTFYQVFQPPLLLPDPSALICAEREANVLRIYDVVAPRMPALEEIVPPTWTALAGADGPPVPERVEVYFDAAELGGGFSPEPHRLDGDDHLMVRGRFPCEGEPVMLPRPARC